ncbi:Uncharacterized protein FKW44_004206 [Caligus rogercresseyi]|uniref:RNA-directed DNA polymerase from transposon X-element n=1 Tax=Caligus rogercresseyi TaxID=217165 RepID=A0A7T8HLE6_CALRO|nr:Uncharacterized protein FKW44_004206 [Caligus rogercresseyi]
MELLRARICAHRRDRLDIILDQAKSATDTSKHVLILGDFNLDTLRHNDRSYSRRSFLQILSDGMKDASLDYATTKATWKSYGKFEGEHRTSCLDHVYSAGLDCSVKVLEDATSDHRPVVANILPWTSIYIIEDVEKVHRFLLDGITVALDEVAPIKTIKVKTGNNLYLAPDTLKLMRERGKASGSEYRRIRNQVSSMVKRDRVRTNVNRLHKSCNDPREAIGKLSAPLPASIEVSGIPTLNSAETATAMNEFYICKVETPERPSSLAAPFVGIAKVIKGMRATEALGVDGIPVSILKKGIEVLAGPIAHLVNRSLASGTVPTALKMSNVQPVFKGKGKSAADSASYRPVLEIVVKSDLEDHLAKTEALPNTQFGFRKGHSTTAALATADTKLLGSSDLTINIGGVEVDPFDEIEFLGVKFDTALTTVPHNITIAKAAAKRAALISRLAVHLPRGKYLRQLNKGLMIGKISFAAAAVTIPRLDNECKGPNAAHRAIQIAINDAARSIFGCKRRDHIHVCDLLERAGLPSLNEVAAKAVALETWKCFYTNDGGGVARNPAGDFVFPIPRRPMRSTTPVAYPHGREMATFACHAISVWNMYKALRSATTLHAARTAARAIGRSVPT